MPRVVHDAVLARTHRRGLLGLPSRAQSGRPTVLRRARPPRDATAVSVGVFAMGRAVGRRGLSRRAPGSQPGVNWLHGPREIAAGSIATARSARCLRRGGPHALAPALSSLPARGRGGEPREPDVALFCRPGRPRAFAGAFPASLRLMSGGCGESGPSLPRRPRNGAGAPAESLRRPFRAARGPRAPRPRRLRVFAIRRGRS